MPPGASGGRKILASKSVIGIGQQSRLSTPASSTSGNIREQCEREAVAIMLFGCETTPPPPPPAPTVVWKLPPNLGKTKSDIGIQMYGPMTTSGGQLEPGLAQQFIEAVQSKMIQSKRFHVYLPNAYGEMPDTGDSDVIVKPFVDIISQPMSGDNGREVVCTICKVALDVKILDKEDGEAKEAINLDGIAKVTVPSVFGKPARDVDAKGLVVKAYAEAYKLLERELMKNFPPAANVVSVRTIQVPPKPGSQPGEPAPRPIVKCVTRGGANIGFRQDWRYMLFAMQDGAPIVIALLEADSIMDEKGSFKSVEVNDTDPEAYDFWARVTAGEKLKLLVTPYLN